MPRATPIIEHENEREKEKSREGKEKKKIGTVAKSIIKTTKELILTDLGKKHD